MSSVVGAGTGTVVTGTGSTAVHQGQGQGVYLPGQYGTVVRASSPVSVVRGPGYGPVASPRGVIHPQPAPVVYAPPAVRFGPAPPYAGGFGQDEYYGRLESPRRLESSRRGPVYLPSGPPPLAPASPVHLHPPHAASLHPAYAPAPVPRPSAIRESLNQLIELILDGRALEAFEKFYAENCVMSENGENERVGKSACRAYEQEFLGSIQRWNDCQVGSVTVDGNTSAVEWVFDLSFFGGKRVVRRQVAVQTWAKGKIVHEVFYHA